MYDLPEIFKEMISDANHFGYKNKQYYQNMFNKAENDYKNYKDDCKNLYHI